MKSKILIHGLWLLLFSFVLPSVACAGLEAGAAKSDITPREWPVFLRGSFSQRGATSAHDPLYSRALVLKNEETMMALAVVDSCYVQREFLDRAKAIAEKETGIPAAHMLVSSTHTHTAPHDDDPYGTAAGVAYQKVLINGVAQSIIDAHANLQAAEAGYGVVQEPTEVFNRRWFLKEGTMPANPFGETSDLVKMNPGRGAGSLVSPAGPTDPDVYVLSVRTPNGRPIALLANYSLHYVGRVPGGQVSADYFGEFARLMENRLSGTKPVPGFAAMLSNGTSADVNNINFRQPRPPREPFEQIRIVASKIADAAFVAYKAIDHRGDLPLAILEREIALERRVPTDAQVENAKATLERLEKDEKSELPKLAESYARRVLKFAEVCEQSPEVKILMHTIRVGDLVICSTPFETFTEIGLRLKGESPFAHTFTIELANGGEGYLPTPKQHRLGGYETWLTTSKVQFDASEIITANLLEMMGKLRKGS